MTNYKSKTLDTFVWIPTKGNFSSFSKIIKNINKLNLDRFLYVIVYENFDLKVFNLLRSTEYKNFLYINKKILHIKDNINFQNILKINKFLKKKFKINFKYFMHTGDDDEFINRNSYLKRLKMLDSNRDITFVTSPISLANYKKKRDLFLESKILSGKEYLEELANNENVQHSSINSIFRIDDVIKSEATIGISLDKMNLWDGFGMDYNLYLKLAFLPNKKIIFLNEKPSRIVMQHNKSMTASNPIAFSYCYYLYSLYLKNLLTKKYNLRTNTFDSFLKTRFKEMIRCYFTVYLSNSKYYPSNNNTPQKFIAFCLKSAFFELKFFNFIKVFLYTIGYYKFIFRLKIKI